MTSPDAIEETSTLTVSSPEISGPVGSSTPRYAQSTSPGPTSFQSSPQKKLPRLLGTERIKLADDVASRADIETHAQPSSNTSNGHFSTRSSLLPPALRRLSSGRSQQAIEAESVRARFQEATRDENVSGPSTSKTMQSMPLRLPSAQQDLRRLRSEIIDPRPRRDTRTIPTNVGWSGRDRTGTALSADSRRSIISGGVSQSRALAHEVLQEAKTDAVHRRRQEDKHMMSKFSNASKSWRNWFMKASTNVD